MRPKKVIIVISGQIKYPSSDSFFLTSQSYVIESGNIAEYDEAIKSFKSLFEPEGYTIVSLVAHVISQATIEKVNSDYVEALENVMEAAEKEKHWNCWTPVDNTERVKAQLDWEALTKVINLARGMKK